MSGEVTRLIVVVVVVVVAIGVAAVLRKISKPPHPDIVVGDAGDRPGVVLFTSTDCGNCKETIALLKAESVAFREITYDIEPQRFESWVVLAVPLCVVLDAEGEVVETMSGVPRLRTLKRALRRAGIRPTP